MKNDTKFNILKFIEKNGPIKPGEIAKSFLLSPQVVHWHLRDLKSKGLINKIGRQPNTHYVTAEKVKSPVQILESTRETIEQNFSYLTPQGELTEGVLAFQNWLEAKNLTDESLPLSQSYVKIFSKVYSEVSAPFSTRARLKTILDKINFSDALTSDFYALPQFGKTVLGNLVHAAKSSLDRKFTVRVAKIIKPQIAHLIDRYNIDMVSFVPHSIPRKLQFLPELQKELRLPLPTIVITKLFSGTIPIAQKSLSKTSERIINAEKTFTIPHSALVSGNVLLIDDAIGSGATINAISNKLFLRGANEVIAFAVVGSYKGFEVITQI